jgi:hypothetical protein
MRAETVTITMTKEDEVSEEVAVAVVPSNYDQKDGINIDLCGMIMQRIGSLETEIGISKMHKKDLDTCLRQLDETIHSKLPPSIVEDIQEIERLQSNELKVPYLSNDFLYQQEELLSCVKTYQTSLQQLDQIQQVLHQSSHLFSPSEDRFRFALEAHPRLKSEEDTIRSLWQRANRIAYRIDTLVGRYHRFILALSEKLVLINEQLSLR